MVTENVYFQTLSPEWRFLKRWLFFCMCLDEIESFQIWWCHTSYTTSITYAMWGMLSYFHCLDGAVLYDANVSLWILFSTVCVLLRHWHSLPSIQSPCESSPCKNGGKCIMSLYKENSFVCDCLEGFYGNYCEQGKIRKYPIKLRLSGFEIRRNFACGIRNQGLWGLWNPECKFQWRRIRNPASRIGTHNSGIHNPSLSVDNLTWSERKKNKKQKQKQ